MNTVTEVMKLSFELQEGKLGKLTEAQKKKLQGMAAELDALNKIKKANEDALKLDAFKSAQSLGTQTMKDGFDQELAGVGMGDKARDRMRADLALRQTYATEVAKLNEQRNTGQITPELYQNETAVLQEELAKRLTTLTYRGCLKGFILRRPRSGTCPRISGRGMPTKTIL